MAPSLLRQETTDGDVISRIFLVRHGDRFDYANPSWVDSAKKSGCLVTDPPLSALGHRQASETAAYLQKIIKENTPNNEDNEEGGSGGIHKILVSPYLRVIQTATPTAHAFGIPLSIENGLSEAHATPDTSEQQVLPTPHQRFAYFPMLDPNYNSLLNVKPTPGFYCPKTGFACEAFAGRYCQRMETFARCLERTHYGQNIVMFSHAASVALVAAFLRCSMTDLKFAPCGVYQLERVNDGPWKIVQSGHDNTSYVKENSQTTYPWGFSGKHFEENDGKYFGSSEGIDLDYFVGAPDNCNL
eukprot:scaffold41244_cov161-Skeletonema_dohrnii-CCMP3373.AAC.2